jgi:hypothetical protein
MGFFLFRGWVQSRTLGLPLLRLQVSGPVVQTCSCRHKSVVTFRLLLFLDDTLQLQSPRVFWFATFPKTNTRKLGWSLIYYKRGKGIPKEREVNRRRENCEWEGWGCAREAIGAPSMLRLIHRAVVREVGEDVANLRFELGVESSSAETELVLVVLRMLNSWSCKKVSRWACKNKMRTRSQWMRPEVVATAGIKQLEWEGRLSARFSREKKR